MIIGRKHLYKIYKLNFLGTQEFLLNTDRPTDFLHLFYPSI